MKYASRMKKTGKMSIMPILDWMKNIPSKHASVAAETYEANTWHYRIANLKASLGEASGRLGNVTGTNVTIDGDGVSIATVDGPHRAAFVIGYSMDFIHDDGFDCFQ